MKKLLFSLALLIALPMVGADQKKDINNNSKEEHPAAKPTEDFALFDELPVDTIKEIFSHLDEKDWFNTFLVKKQFKQELNNVLEKKFGIEEFKLYKAKILTKLLEKKNIHNKVENKLKEISAYWLKSNRIKGFHELWDNILFSGTTSLTFGEKISTIAPIFIQYAHQCSVEGWVKLDKQYLYSSLNAKSWNTSPPLAPDPYNWDWNSLR